MAYAESDNKQLPDTQEISTEEESESIYAESIFTSASWAKLIYIPNHKFSIDLRFDQTWFGRESPENKNIDVFVINNRICPPKFADRISKCHFTIDKEKSTGEKRTDNYLSPAILTCYGRNGLFINDDKLNLGDKQILAHNDVIKLTKKYELFRFCYQVTAPELSTLPTSCLKKYHIGIQIGSGGCGIVRLVHELRSTKKFAMKVIKKETNPMVRSRFSDNAKILNEVNIMKKLSHPHVLNLMDFFETPERVIIIMDYMEGKDLLHRITQHDQTRKNLNEMDAKFFFLQACKGLKYLHDSFVTHRDIKPDNILLNSNSPNALLKISDFGLSKLITIDSMKTVCGTQLYVAPEVLIGGGTYTNKVDIWSMGCLLFAMLSGSVPFCDAYGPPDVQTQIRTAKFAFKHHIWNDVSRTARELIKRMLQKEPELRPSIDQIIDHPWLKCSKTISRVQKLYKLDETMMNSSNESEFELTLVNVSLNEQKSAIPPPMKKRRIE